MELRERIDDVLSRDASTEELRELVVAFRNGLDLDDWNTNYGFDCCDRSWTKSKIGHDPTWIPNLADENDTMSCFLPWDEYYGGPSFDLVTGYLQRLFHDDDEIDEKLLEALAPSDREHVGKEEQLETIIGGWMRDHLNQMSVSRVGFVGTIDPEAKVPRGRDDA